MRERFASPPARTAAIRGPRGVADPLFVAAIGRAGQCQCIGGLGCPGPAQVAGKRDEAIFGARLLPAMPKKVIDEAGDEFVG